MQDMLCVIKYYIFLLCTDCVHITHSIFTFHSKYLIFPVTCSYISSRQVKPVCNNKLILFYIQCVIFRLYSSSIITIQPTECPSQTADPKCCQLSAEVIIEQETAAINLSHTAKEMPDYK